VTQALEEQFCCSCHATDMLQKFQKEKQILTILKKSTILENLVQSIEKRLQED
jgi:hypothetical protein